MLSNQSIILLFLSLIFISIISFSFFKYLKLSKSNKKLVFLNLNLKKDKSNVQRKNTNLFKKYNYLKEEFDASEELNDEYIKTTNFFLSQQMVFKSDIEKISSELNRKKQELGIIKEKFDGINEKFTDFILSLIPNIKFLNHSENKLKETINKQSIKSLSDIVILLLKISSGKNIGVNRKINRVQTAKTWVEIRLSKDERLYYRGDNFDKILVIISDKNNQASDIALMQKY